MTDTQRLDWLDRNGDVLRHDLLSQMSSRPAWWIRWGQPNYKRPRFATVREAIDAAIEEVGG